MGGTKRFVLFAVFLLLMPIAYSEKIGVFVEFPDGLESDCVDISGTAKDALEASKFDAEYSYAGMFLDAIDGYESDVANSRSWWFFFAEDDEIEESVVGITDYDPEEGGFIYFGYYTYDESFHVENTPQEVSFFEACPSEANELELKDMYLDTGEDRYRGVNGSVIFVEPGQEFVLYVELRNNLLGEVPNEDAATVYADISFAWEDEVLWEDMVIGPDDTEVVSFTFKLPDQEPGYYKGNICIEANDEYAEYSHNERLILGVRREVEEEIEIPDEEVPEEPETVEEESPTGAVVAPVIAPQKTTGTETTIITVLFVVLIVGSIALIAVMLRK